MDEVNRGYRWLRLSGISQDWAVFLINLTD
jgi:hypothetical protein